MAIFFKVLALALGVLGLVLEFRVRLWDRQSQPIALRTASGYRTYSHCLDFYAV